MFTPPPSPPNVGIMRKGFVTPGQTVNGNFYCDVLRWLRVTVRHKHPIKWCINSWALYHKNAPTHTSFFLLQLLASMKMTVFPNLFPHQTSARDFFSLFSKYETQGVTFREHRRDPNRITGHKITSTSVWHCCK
jgi:hypothetical protein